MQIKEVLIKDVKLGMCLANDTTNNKNEVIYRKGFYFTSREQIIRLLDEGVKSILVNITASLIDMRSSKQIEQSQEFVKKENEALYKQVDELDAEQEKVIDLYQSSQNVINDLMNNARFGKALNLDVVQKQTIDVLNSIRKNELALLSLINLKNFDEYTYTHSLNVSILSAAFAWNLKFPEDQLISIGRGAFFHDIGKAKVPLSIVNKPGALSESEKRIMQMHPSYGEQIYNQEIITNEIERGIVTQHHESFDGSGYPHSLEGNRISKYASIVSISDFFDALTTVRSYRPEVHPSEVIQIIYSLSAKKFDPRVVNHFIKTIGIYPIGSLVELSNDQIAIVKAFSKENLLKPIVELLKVENGYLASQNKIVSLMESEVYVKSVYKGEGKLVEKNIMKKL
ncbi:MAG TPA: HD-GYP domain-containing protein [Candidatus Cloacimonadota bacterium]|nr:HD-GYP domain-containing protein [Candidatus Cloacimonadota bacterium]HOQ80251.1 HD-GYP domain-containing protein [Candidatus Cloacimonadota bacterium]